MRSPLFSIITAVFNGAKTLETTIASVTAQTCRDFEYLVVDGGSTDGTLELLRKAGDQVTWWSSAPDKGVYDAFNRGLAQARGTWIAFLGADDTYRADALQQYRLAIENPKNDQVEYISSRVELCSGSSVIRTVGEPWSWPAFAKYMTVAHVGSMHHASLFQRYGAYDSSYRICGDYELLLRAGKALRAAYLDQVTARMTARGMSDNDISSALAEQERAKRATAGRSRYLCAFERRAAHLRAVVRRLIWY